MDIPFPQGWTAERDGSLHTSRRGYVAVEIVSPILKGRAGIEQIKQMAEVLRQVGAAVNPTCGMHIHVGARSVAGERPPRWRNGWASSSIPVPDGNASTDLTSVAQRRG